MQGWTGPVHHVKAGDTLWDLAEHYLGSGTRWHEIADLNTGVRQADGTVLTGNVLELQIGWTLRLPTSAAAPAGPTQGGGTSTDRPQHTVVVHAGDTLSQIAQDELGDGDRYPELLDATRDLVQPDGSHLTDPDDLLPGQVIVIPGSAATPTPPPSAKATPAPPTETAPSTSTPAPATPGTATPKPDSTPTPTATTPPAEATPAPATTPPTDSAPTADTPPPAAPDEQAAPDPSAVSQSILGVGALLGAGFLAALTALRIIRHRRRKPGQTIAVPEETAPIERLLDSTSSPASVELLDRALRTLAHRHPDQLPALRGAQVTATEVLLLPDVPAPGPGPVRRPRERLVGPGRGRGRPAGAGRRRQGHRPLPGARHHRHRRRRQPPAGQPAPPRRVAAVRHCPAGP